MIKVLVVDDDDSGRLMIEHALRQAGYEVETARDGREALEMLRVKPIQVVVSDWGMPILNGLELCRAIRSTDFGHYIYFIMLTCRSRPEDALEGLEAGADDFITKPFNPTELILRVNVGRRTVALDTRDLTIFAIGKLAESRDSETGTHLARISSYCTVLARRLLDDKREELGIDEEFVRLIGRTSPLHDIGKIAIPDCILLKPDRLDASEYEIIKMHPVYGARMLEAAIREFPNAGFLKMARDIALTHHERFDGGGYPQALVGKAIPLAGRIVALADVYDALTTKRIYKIAFTHDSATKIILEQSQGQFDPQIIAAFLAEQERFRAIGEEYSEEATTYPFLDAAAVFTLPSEVNIKHDDAYLSSTHRR
jgi:putative two-component system response regulator